MIVCRKLSLLLRSCASQCDSLVSSSSHLHHHLLAHILRFSTSVTDQQNLPPQTPFIIGYLVDSCGLSPAAAARASKYEYVALIKSPSKPDKVLHFLKRSGLSDGHISALISKNPMLLCVDVEATLKPKLQALQKLGFSDQDLHQLIVLCSSALAYRDFLPKIKFWRDFYSDNIDHFFKAIKMDPYLLTTTIDKRIMPSMSILRRCGLSDRQIAKISIAAPRILTRTANSMEVLVRRAEELGVPAGSAMFYYALCAVNSVSAAKIEAKIGVLRSMGCLEADIKSAIRKCPSLLCISEKKMRDCMDFLTKRAGCETSYVILHPVLLRCSLERKLVPRTCVLQILWSKESSRRGRDLFKAMTINEKEFLEKYVLPYKESIPEIHETYISACAGKVAVESKH